MSVSAEDKKFAGQMTVIKRNGMKEVMTFEKVNKRISYLNKYPCRLRSNYAIVANKVTAELTDGIKTTIIDEHAARVANEMGVYNSHYQVLAARIAISNHQKNTARYGDCFSGAMEACYRNKSIHGGKDAPRISQELYKFVQLHKNSLNKMIDYERDFNFSYFGFSTLVDRYLLKASGPRDTVESRPQDYAIERPQDMWMRVACSLHRNRVSPADPSVLPLIKQTYDLLSEGYIMHATPTLYNAGTTREQLLSCFLCAGGDSIEDQGGIADLLKNTMTISKYSGGIGFWWDLRHDGAEVKSTNGISRGMIPFLKQMEAAAIAVDQGGKRKGSFAHYLEPIHPVFPKWLELRLQTGYVNKLFYGAWIPDLFMEAVESDKDWYFFDPVDFPEIYNAYGEEFRKLYDLGVAKGLNHGKPVKARKLWETMLQTQTETGMPYMLFKDACNAKSNQKNLGIIKSSNLCTEILEVSSPTQYACCCVAAICLPKYVTVAYDECMHETDEDHNKNCKRTATYDYKALARNTGVMVVNLNRVIDINFYPVKETKQNNLDTRPLAIGVQGLADVFMDFRIPFTSAKAKQMNKWIHEAIYYGALRESCNQAKIHGPYIGFEGSPFSQGIFQWEMCGIKESELSGMFDWASLRRDVMTYGVRNSLLTSRPPTASTSHIQGNNECFEPYTDMFYVRKTLSGEFIVINHHMINHMTEFGLWNDEVRNELIAGRGSVQDIKSLPADFKEIYQTVWEYKGRDLIDMAADAGAFVDQSSSLNQWVADPDFGKLTSMHFYSWKKGLKTGMYYLRSLSQSKSVQFSESAKTAAAIEVPKDFKILKNGKVAICNKEEGCTMCGV